MFKKILVPLDTSSLAEQALPLAAAIAAASSAELCLLIAHELAPGAGYADAPWNAARATMEGAYVDGIAPELASRFGIRVTIEHPKGPAAASIVASACSNGVDLVVMTTHGRTGLSREWLGSVADTVMRSLDVPVLMLHPKPSPPHGATSQAASLRRIMIPLDGSPRAESILNAAFALGGSDATFILTRIVPTVPLFLNTVDPYTMSTFRVDPEATEVATGHARRYMEDVTKRFGELGATHIERRLEIAEHAGPSLLYAATAVCADVIAIATHGRGASRFVFGSVADKLLRGSAASLLVVRGPRE